MQFQLVAHMSVELCLRFQFAKSLESGNANDIHLAADALVAAGAPALYLDLLAGATATTTPHNCIRYAWCGA